MRDIAVTRKTKLVGTAAANQVKWQRFVAISIRQYDMTPTEQTLYEQIQWTAEGLVPAIAQNVSDGRVLMMAWMNRESLQITIEEGRATYWSRSRQRLWRKGESSGHSQLVRSIHLDCDGDALLLNIEQMGGIACHTGRASCFYRKLDGHHWQESEPVLRNPEEIYP